MSKLHLVNRIGATFLYVLEFCISILILGIFSWYLAVLDSRHNAFKPNWIKAVEGLSGASALYCVFAVLLTCFFGGISFFAFLGVVFDVIFCGAMVAIAILTRAGHRSCSSTDYNSPIGTGHHTACRTQQTAFAVSIIGAFFFAISVFVQISLARSHKREKRYGPSPANNYTSGSGGGWRSRFGRRNRKAVNGAEMGTANGSYNPAV